MATLTVYPASGANAPVDGYVQRDLGAGTPESFATIRSAAGNGSSATSGADRVAALDAGATTDQYKRLNRAIFGFDLATIAGATVNSATLSLSPTAKNNSLGSDDIHFCSATPASNSSLANSDYGNLGSTSFGSIAYADWTADGGYDDATLNASGLTHITNNLGTYVFFGSRLNWDINNTTTGLTWVSGLNTRYEAIFADNAGTTRDPKLTVDYTAAAGTAIKDLIGGLGIISFQR